MKISYTKGDATTPKGEGNKIIIHVCNDVGGWGKGFVLALSKKWKLPETKYREWYASKENFSLGKVQFVQVEDDLWIGNMIGQHGVRKYKDGIPPIRYEAIEQALKAVAQKAIDLDAEVHAPRFGAGLAGGDWNVIEKMINDQLISKGVKCTIYDF